MERSEFKRFGRRGKQSESRPLAKGLELGTEFAPPAAPFPPRALLRLLWMRTWSHGPDNWPGDHKRRTII